MLNSEDPELYMFKDLERDLLSFVFSLSLRTTIKTLGRCSLAVYTCCSLSDSDFIATRKDLESNFVVTFVSSLTENIITSLEAPTYASPSCEG